MTIAYNQASEETLNTVICSKSSSAEDRAAALVTRGNLKSQCLNYVSAIADYSAALHMENGLTIAAQGIALVHRAQARFALNELTAAALDYRLAMSTQQLNPEYHKIAFDGNAYILRTQANLKEILRSYSNMPRSQAVLQVTRKPVFSPRMGYCLYASSPKKNYLNHTRISLALKEAQTKKQDKPLTGLSCFP